MKSRHTEWRKLAKKSRRKRIRQKIAQERDLAEEYGKDVILRKMYTTYSSRFELYLYWSR